jgi:hypothetical protein
MWQALLPVLMVGLGVFANLIAASEEPVAPNLKARLSVFLSAILLLSMIVVGVAGLLRRRNREVILLKKRLAEIYLSAVRKSAFNPQPTSTTPHE